MADLTQELNMPQQKSSIITVIGVGGAGGNAVNHMYNMGITGVNFLICNTDQRAMDNSPVKDKICLGKDGLGAGNDPEKGRAAAEESIERIKEYIKASGTRMVFITAGMGGGTGTGASPVIAKLAQELGLLTIANVTSPLMVEGPLRCEQAAKGIEELRQYADSLLVINNESIRDMYGKLPISQAFGMADDILASATKGIAEIITVENAFIRVDFADLERVMRNSGRAHMGVAAATGEGRALEAARRSLCSPLLDNNLISGAKNILINISAADVDDVAYDETMEILNYIQSYATYRDDDGVDHMANLIWGISSKPMPEGELEVVVVATGFSNDDYAHRVPPQPAFVPQPFTQQHFDTEIVPMNEVEEDDEKVEISATPTPMTPPTPLVSPTPMVAQTPRYTPPQPAAAPQQRYTATQAVLDRKPMKYSNIDTEIRTPAFKRRNVKFVIEQSDGASRRKEVLRDDRGEQGDDSAKNLDAPLF